MNEEIEALGREIRRRRQALGMLVGGEDLLHEKLVAAQQGGRAQLGGGFDGEEIQGQGRVGNASIIPGPPAGGPGTLIIYCQCITTPY